MIEKENEGRNQDKDRKKSCIMEGRETKWMIETRRKIKRAGDCHFNRSVTQTWDCKTRIWFSGPSNYFAHPNPVFRFPHPNIESTKIKWSESKSHQTRNRAPGFLSPKGFIAKAQGRPNYYTFIADTSRELSQPHLHKQSMLKGCWFPNVERCGSCLSAPH